MHDELIISLFWDFCNHKTTSSYRRFNQKQNKYENINNYLYNRFEDSTSRIESLLRIAYNIEKRPICPVCGKPLKFIGKPNTKGIFTKHCSEECRRKDINIDKAKHTKLKRYNNANYNNLEQSKKTKLERYGDEHYNNREGAILTNIKKHDVKYFVNQEKTKETKKNKYNDENYNNREKSKETCLLKYNKEHYVNKEKMVKTKLEKYGNAWGDINKIKQTKLERYGDENYVNPLKAKQTKLERYGDENYNNKYKSKQTCLNRYGTSSWVNSIIGRKILSERLLSDDIRNKIYNRHKLNNSFNKSNSEEDSYVLLKEKHPDVIRQYKSEEYPFNCDFYIPNLNLYIECNYSWTHGFRPYLENDVNCLTKLNKWKSKNTEYYNKAIETWTIRDTRKRKIAKENNLNWVEFFNINELKTWLGNNL